MAITTDQHGVFTMVSASPLTTDFEVKVGIDCINGSVLLSVPRRRAYSHRAAGSVGQCLETRRLVLETLQEQILNQLAVEAMEGR